MHKDLPLSGRQQSLAFAVDDVWERLPSDVRRQCEDRIVQLLEAALLTERQERSHGNERQNST